MDRLKMKNSLKTQSFLALLLVLSFEVKVFKLSEKAFTFSDDLCF